MKLDAYKEQLDNNPELWLKRAGYAMINDQETNISSFVRRLTRDFYPRFHIYISVRVEGLREIVTLNLHLDQKKPAYSGQKRHNAEYEGETVEAEARRLATFLRKI